MQVTILVVHVLAALGLVGLVLLQHGKGADMGAAFGSGSAGSLFGASGSSNFLSRSTAIFALVFFLSSMGLSYLSFENSKTLGILSTQELPVSPDSMVEDVPTPADNSGDPDSKVNEIPK